MFYFIFVARMSYFCPFATISFRTSCHVCSDGMKKPLLYASPCVEGAVLSECFMLARIVFYA